MLEASQVHLNITVGAWCEVEPGWAAGVRFRSRFVGWIPGRSCVRLPPRRADLTDALTPENELIVRFLDTRGMLCGFRTYVQTLVHVPQRLLFVDYPASLETLRIRKQDRVRCFLPAELDSSGTRYAGHLVDISTGGFRFSCDRKSDGEHSVPPRGADLICRFSLLDEALQNIETEAVVKDVLLPPNRVVVRGLFQHPPDETARAIADYVATATRHIESSYVANDS